MALKKYTSPAITTGLIKFVGGLNSTAGPLELSEQESSSLQNVDFDKFGSISKRNGYLNANSSAINSGARVTGLADYELSTGTRYLVTVVGSKVYQWNQSAITGAPTDITGAITVTAGALASRAVFRDTALFTNGTDAPFQWTGTGNCTVSTVPTSLTAAKYNAVFQNYYFLANVTVGGTNYRSRIHYTNINTISTWTDSDFVDVSRDDGQQITGLGTLGDRLVIFKDRSIWVAFFTGNADAPFQFVQTNSAVGSVSHWSVQNIDNGIVFLSWDGVYFFDGFNSTKISDRLNSTFQNDLAPAQLVNATSMYQHSKNRYYLATTTTGGSTNDTVITWTRSQTTTVTDAFGIHKGWAPSQMEMVYPDGVTETPYFGDYSGFVYKADTGTNDFPLGVSTAITAFYYTNWLSFDDLVDKKETLSVYLYYATNPATLTFVYSYDLNQGDTYSLSVSTTAGGALWDTAVWDVDTWAGGIGASQRLDLDDRGRLVRFGVKNSTLGETFRLDGLGTLTYAGTHV